MTEVFDTRSALSKRCKMLMLVLTSAPPMENGDAEMATDDTWEQKGGEPSEAEAEPGGPGRDCGQPEEDSPQEEGMEEEEEVPTPKVVPTQPNAPKKEHVNVVFIGHVG